MNSDLHRFIAPGIVVGIAAVFLLGVMLPPSDAAGQMNLSEAARLPVVDGGRVMPLDTVARNSLMIVSGKQTFTDEKGNRQPAIKWLLDLMVTYDMKDLVLSHGSPHGPNLKNPAAFHHKVFRVENDQVLDLLHLKRRSGFRYSMYEMLPREDEFIKQVQRAGAKPSKDLDLFSAKVLDLGKHWKVFSQLTTMQTPLVIPPLQSGEEWRSLPEALKEDLIRKRRDTATWEFVEMLSAYAKGDAAEFNKSLASYQKLIEKHLPDATAKTDFEAFFNNFAPFYWCAVLYVFVLILTCAGWIAFPKELCAAAFALAVLTLGVHTFAMFGRMYLMERPFVFVTNLYSSAVFIGWIGVGLGLALERTFRNSLGMLVASVVGALTLVVGHYLATTSDKPDTLEMMQAVLDTNFWLATHVTSVTIGYSATFIAGFLGIVLIIMGVFTKLLSKDNYRTLGQMIYGIVCFAMFFSFVGTVLGGIWADQSWGRFWGWDPKENGALLIVIWNALILHARWGGMVQQRGMAVLAVFGNIITTWSWFGVNMLGVGLHSYGFTSSQLFWVLTFVATQLVVMGIGLVPIRLWPSFVAQNKTAAMMKSDLQTASAQDAAPINAGPPRRHSHHIKA